MNSPETAAQLTDPQRLRAVAAHGFRGGAPREDLDAFAELARHALDAEAALLTVLDARWQHVVAGADDERLPIPRGGVPVAHSLCAFVVRRQAQLVVHDTAAHWLLAEHPATGESGLRTYAGVPFRGPGGQILGALCAVGRTPRSWAAQHLGDLENLARLARHELELTALPSMMRPHALPG